MKVWHNIKVSRTTVSVKCFFKKVCLQDNRVFLIYLAIYDRTIINIECWCFFFLIELLALSDNAILFTLTPGNDYFVLVFMWPNIRSDTCGRVEFSTILSITILSFIVVYALLPCYSECIYLLSVVVSDLNNNNF